MLSLSDLKELAELSASERAYLTVYLAGPHSVAGLEKRFDTMRRLLRTGGAQKDEKEYFDDNVRLATEYLDHHPLKSGALCILAIRQQILLVPTSSAVTMRWRLLLIVVV